MPLRMAAVRVSDLPTGVDQQGFCKLDVNAHELAGRSLDMAPDVMKHTDGNYYYFIVSPV